MSPAGKHTRTARSCSWLLALLLLLITALPSHAATPETRRVFLLHSFQREYLWTENVTKGIDEVFSGSDLRVETYTAFMEMKRVPYSEHYFNQLKELYRERYKNVRFDAILASDNDALDFLRKYRDELFPGVPVVFSAINDFDSSMLDGRKDVTGYPENTDYVSTIKLALQLLPKAKAVVVVTDNTTTGRAHNSAVHKIEPSFSGQLRFEYLSVGDYTFTEVAEKLGALTSDSIVLLLHHFMDKTGATQSVQEGTPLLTSRCPAPCFAVADIRVGLGALGGNVVSGYHYGKAAAKMVVDILHGADVRDIPIGHGPNQNKFDYQVLLRFGISETSLPKDSVIINKPVSIFDQHPHEIIGIIIAFVLLGGFLVAMGYEILRRKRIELALRESEERFRVLVEQAPEAITVYDAELERFVDANVNAELLFGCGREELLHSGPRRFFPPEQPDGQTVEASMQQHIEATLAGEKLSFERLIVNAASRELYSEVRLVRLPSTGRKLLRCSYVDISGRKKAEAERMRLVEQLQQAQKMESVGRLAGGVAHDFNNMLGVILGHAEMALDSLPPAQSVRVNLEEIRKAAQRSANLTRQLLAFARKQTIDPKVLDLNAAVAGMLKMLQRLIGEDINLTWQPKTGLWPIKVDPSQIDQILANLCVNSRDAITGVGKITIETGNTIFDEEYCAASRYMTPGEYVLLAVSDDGCGMDKETSDKIFEPFFTTKEMGKGVGLGMATVYGIVKQNNGFITVYSEPGRGSTFTVYLPRHLGKEDQVGLEEESSPAMQGTETILLVEDESSILEMIARMLEGLGYTVLKANSPGEASRLAEEHEGTIDLLMTDVVMPEMNGKDLASNLLTLSPQMKSLFMSGYTANVIAHHGVLDNGVHFIEKPFTIKDLAAKVRDVLDSEDVQDIESK